MTSAPKLYHGQKKNAEKILGTCDLIEIKKSNVLSSLDEKVDIVISNPPYITKAEMNELEAELAFEPFIALSPGGDGLDIYRKIAKQSWGFLNDKGFVVLEIGFGKEELVKNIFKDYKFILEKKDFNEVVRLLVFQKS